jgi:hypothetical protein
VLQALPQLVPSQVACAFGSTGVAQGAQRAPQLFRLAFDTQLLLQTCEPPAQLAQKLPEHYWLAQSDGARQPIPFGHAFPCPAQTPPQSTPVSFWFLSESEHESAAQAMPPAGWYPELHETNTQVPPVQLPTPLAYRVVQSMQPDPQQVLCAETQASFTRT